MLPPNCIPNQVIYSSLSVWYPVPYCPAFHNLKAVSRNMHEDSPVPEQPLEMGTLFVNMCCELQMLTATYCTISACTYWGKVNRTGTPHGVWAFPFAKSASFRKFLGESNTTDTLMVQLLEIKLHTEDLLPALLRVKSHKS